MKENKGDKNQMEDTSDTAVALEVPESALALVSAIGFAHAAVQNDDAWAAVYAQTSEGEQDMPASEELREHIHAAVDAVMASTRQTLVLSALGQLPQLPAAPEAPAADDDSFYGSGMYI